ncbi:MAG: hypothetical protein FWE37_05330 [Spirochaetaceae bacterium]|nr:hypothetical protein [Spirochaetaceae bacterium]
MQNKQGIAAYKKAMGKENKVSPKDEAKNLIKNPAKSKTKPSPKAMVSPNLPPKIHSKGKSGKRKSAELLLLVGQEEAANILKHMSLGEVEEVVKELAEIKELKKVDIDSTLSSFITDTEEQGLFKGGVDVARGFLKVAFGDEEGERILRNATPDDKPFAFLEELDKEQLSTLLKDESIETLAVIIPRLKPQIAKEVLANVSVIYQGDLIKRIAQGRKVDGSIITRIEEILRERLKKQGGQWQQIETDGKKALADMIRYMDNSEAKQIMQELPDEVAKEIEEYIFDVDTLLLIADRDFQTFLHNMNEYEIAVLLKGKTSEIRAKFLRNVSASRKTLIEKEESLLQPMRRSEVNQLTREFLDKLKELERKGKLVLMRDSEEYL